MKHKLFIGLTILVFASFVVIVLVSSYQIKDVSGSGPVPVEAQN